jgi:hypothetical protein
LPYGSLVRIASLAAPGVCGCSGWLSHQTIASHSRPGPRGYAIDANRELTIILHEVYLSGGKTPISGPSGVEAAFNFRSAFNATAGCMMTVTLQNQQAASEYT